MHKVVSAKYLYGEDHVKNVLPCPLNPGNLLCSCKGSRHHGICSHILAVSHLLSLIDLNAELAPLAPTRERHGPRAAVGGAHIQPADGRMPQQELGEGEEEQDVDISWRVNLP